MQAASFQGPVPPPEWLARYEEICPGFADRTLALVEKQSASRQANERLAIESNIRHEGQGQWMAFVLALVFFVMGGYSMYLHEIGIGVGVWAVNIVAILSMFIYRVRRNERRAAQGLPPQNFTNV